MRTRRKDYTPIGPTINLKMNTDWLTQPTSDIEEDKNLKADDGDENRETVDGNNNNNNGEENKKPVDREIKNYNLETIPEQVKRLGLGPTMRQATINFIGKNVILETAAKTVHLAVENNKREKEKKRVAKKQRDDAKQRLRKFQQDSSVSFKAFFKKSNV